jgi:hypothetical protein
VASYSVVTAKHATTSAGVVDTITFSGNMGGLRVRNRDATDVLYFRFDGTDPGVAADDSYVVGAGESLSVDQRGVSEVRVISSGACDYSVEVY